MKTLGFLWLAFVTIPRPKPATICVQITGAKVVKVEVRIVLFTSISVKVGRGSRVRQQNPKGIIKIRVTDGSVGCGQESRIPVLVSAGLLQPLGDPPANGVKHFAAIQILELAGDVARLSKICNRLYQYWRGKNASKGTAEYKPRPARNGHR